MSRRGRRLATALAGLVALLFAGRWFSALCADRWWAAEVSPASTAFLTDWHFLTLVLDVTGVVLASAWFIGHFLVVYRAVGSVQVRRNVANLEIREALTPGALLAVTAMSGAVLGLLVGAGTSRLAPEVALAWQGVSYGDLDPLLQRDLGLYVAQLPVWRAAHSFFFLLEVLGLGTVFGLYLLVGAVRWIEGRPAINSHARIHLGWLLVGFALVLMWGYLLERYEFVAGLDATPDQAQWRAVALTAPLLAGVAVATAVLSAAWAVRARHALAAAGWIVLAGASLVGHWMVPPAMTGGGEPLTDNETDERLDRAAYGMGSLATTTLSQVGPPEPPRIPSLWNPATIARALSADSVEVLSIAPAVLTIRNGKHPVWLAARRTAVNRMSLVALADDRIGSAGEPLYYHAKDSVARPGLTSLLELAGDASRPGAPRYRLHGREGPGMPVSPWPRRVMLTWALQASRLLGRLPPDARVDWELAPVDRLARLTPFASWGEPVPRIIDGELVWLVDGYVAAASFPLAPRAEWRARKIGSLRASFVGTVTAETGTTRIFLRPGDDPLGEAWAAVSEGVVEPSSAIPMTVVRALPYPVELLRVQSRALERPGGKLGRAGVRAAGADTSTTPRPDLAWSPDTTEAELVIAYERATDRRVGALLVANPEDGNDALRLIRLDSARALPSRAALESRWSRFPSFGALSDSIRDDGGRLERGPVRFDLTPTGVVAYQAHFAHRGDDETIVVWVSVASEGRLGAGHNFGEAWSNLLGATVPSVAGAAVTTRLEEARRLLLRADSALRAGDWVTFGRAWDTLRKSFGIQTESDAP